MFDVYYLFASGGWEVSRAVYHKNEKGGEDRGTHC